MSASSGSGFNISGAAIRNPVGTVMLMLLLVVFGLISYSRLTTELYPKTNFGIVSIQTIFSGASSSEIETLVTRPLEEAVSSISGIKRIMSTSSNGRSSVVIEFHLDKEIQNAAQEVREKVSLARENLPQAIEEPVIARDDPDASAVVSFALSGNQPLEELSAYSRDTLKPALERLDGVAQISLLGMREREIRIFLDPTRLHTYHLTPADISARLQEENLDFPSGELETQSSRMILRTLNAYKTASQVANTAFRLNSGQVIHLSDLGEVQDGFRDMKSRSWFDGRPAVVLGIRKQSGSNTVAVAEAAIHAITEQRENLPKGMSLDLAFNTAQFVEESTEAAQEELLIGSALAMIVIWLFLRSMRGTLIAGLAIPTSVIGTYGLMYMMDFTLNTMSLMALALVVGILVDDAVVDLENIYRHLELGTAPKEAALKATDEIGLAVVATTLSIVAVFVPVAFMGGMIGQFFRQFGLTVSFAVLISLLVARTLTPMLAAYFLKPLSNSHDETTQSQRGMGAVYRKILVWSLQHRGLTLGAAALAFILSIPLAGLLPQGFVPKADRDEFTIALESPSDATLPQTESLLKTLVERVKTDPEVSHLLVTAGNAQGQTHVGTVAVTLKTRKQGRKDNLFEIQRRLQNQTRDLPGAVLSFRETQAVEDNSALYAVNLSLQGPELSDLQTVANQVLTELHQQPLITDSRLSIGTRQQELHISVDKDRAIAQGVTPAAIARTLESASLGERATQLRLPTHKVDVRVQLDPSRRYNPEELRTLPVRRSDGSLLPLDSLVDMTFTEGPTSIARYNRTREIVVQANAAPGTSLSEVLDPLRAYLQTTSLPKDVKWEFRGDAEYMNEAFSSMIFALGLAVLFLYMILATQFKHFLHPFTIMISLPLSFAGAFMALFLADQELGLMSLIGIVMLMGLVTKNSILLVDYTLTLRQEGYSRQEALLHAGPVRLRPILMTTLAMIVGMLPVALKLTVGSEGRSPMAVGVIGGLITSTLLTLIVVPVMYTLLDDFDVWLRQRTNKTSDEHQHVV